MKSFQPITKAEFAKLRWSNRANFEFASKDPFVFLLAREMPKACMWLPIAFFQQDEGFIPVAVQSLGTASNYLVHKGKWVAPYIPAAYRGYPFALTEGADEKLHLCVDMESGLVGEGSGFEYRFFEENGEAGKEVLEFLKFLVQVHRGRAETSRICSVLASENLLQPWRLRVQTSAGDHGVDGLYRIDEERLKGLDAEALHRLHAAGSLPVIYCQLLSMGNIQALGQIYRKVDELKKSHASPSKEVDLDGFFTRQGTGGPTFESAAIDDSLAISLEDDLGELDISALTGSKAVH
jgi:hypothetical protein